MHGGGVIRGRVPGCGCCRICGVLLVLLLQSVHGKRLSGLLYMGFSFYYKSGIWINLREGGRCSNGLVCVGSQELHSFDKPMF